MQQTISSTELLRADSGAYLVSNLTVFLYSGINMQHKESKKERSSHIFFLLKTVSNAS